MRIATGAAIVFLALAIGTAGAGAQDQKQPTTAQGAKPDTKFTSPITAKDKTGTKEATDFSKLVKLYEERERIRCSPDRRGLMGAMMAYIYAEHDYLRDHSPHYETQSYYDDDEGGSGPSVEDYNLAEDAGKLGKAVKQTAKPQKCPNGPGSAQYTSPFGETKALGCEEASDFTALVALSKKLKKAEDEYERDHDDAKAEKEFKEADDAYGKALGKFIRDWSNNLYGADDPTKDKKVAETWQKDKNKVEAYLDMLWDKEPGVACPKKTTSAPPTEKKKPKRKTKRARKEDDPLYMEHYQPPRRTSHSPSDDNAGMPQAPPDTSDDRRPPPDLPGPPHDVPSPP